MTWAYARSRAQAASAFVRPTNVITQVIINPSLYARAVHLGPPSLGSYSIMLTVGGNGVKASRISPRRADAQELPQRGSGLAFVGL